MVAFLFLLATGGCTDSGGGDGGGGILPGNPDGGDPPRATPMATPMATPDGPCAAVVCDPGLSCEADTGECSCGGADCGDDEICVGGSCQRADCQDPCAPGTEECSEGGVRSCAMDLGQEGCFRWGPVTPCDPGERCEDGACVPRGNEDPCEDISCTAPEVCDPATGTCADPGDDVEPTAEFSVTPDSGDTNTEFRFDAAASVDPEDDAALVLRWDFDGDESFDTDWSTMRSITHRYDEAGVFVALLEVRDSVGQTDRAFEAVEVEAANSPPSARFGISPDEGDANTEFTFTATVSDAEDEDAQVEVRWDFEGDGTFDTSLSDAREAKHRYAAPGEYRPTLEARDSRGASVVVDRLLVVSAANTPPRPAFTVTPPRGATGSDFLFDASTSADDEDGNGDLRFEWDFDGDGDFDESRNGISLITHRYSSAGIFVVVLRVTDSGGASAQVVERVEACEGGCDPDAAPEARLIVTPQIGAPGELFTADASASSDPEDGSDLEFRFDFGVGATSEWGDTPTASHRYDAPGTFTVRVDVRDSRGNRDSASDSVQVQAGNRPPEVRITSPTDNALLVLGAPLELRALAEDPDETLPELAVTWSHRAGGGAFGVIGSGRITTHLTSTLSPGTHEYRVEVADADGLTATDSVSVRFTACTATSQCPGNRQCRGGVCRASTGAAGEPCDTDGDCLVGSCVTRGDERRFHGGYCAITGCANNDQVNCLAGTTCYFVSDAFVDSLCYANCASDADCRAEYRCSAPGSPGAVCVARCQQDDECDPSRVCELSSGVCMPRNCNTNGSGNCPAGLTCARTDADTGDGVCVYPCDAVVQNCSRGGQGCYSFGVDDTEGCLPRGRVVAGNPCNGNVNDCVEGAQCIRANDGNGCFNFCDTRDPLNSTCSFLFEGCWDLGSRPGLGVCAGACQANTDCGPGFVCLAGGCFTACSRNSDCPGQGYTCRDGACQ